MSKLFPVFFGLCFLLVGCHRETPPSVDSQTIADFNPQPLLNSIDEIIQQAVGSGVDEQIPGYTFHDNEVDFTSGGIECPTNVSNVNMAADLIEKKLASNFGDTMDTPKIDRFPPEGDVVFNTTLRQKDIEIHVAVSIFQRGSGRVILFQLAIDSSAMRIAAAKRRLKIARSFNCGWCAKAASSPAGTAEPCAAIFQPPVGA